MLRGRWLSGLVAGLAGLLLITPAVAWAATPVGLPFGVPPPTSSPTLLLANHSMTLSVNSPADSGAVFALGYSSGASVTIQARIQGLDGASGSLVGFDIYEGLASTIPVGHTTLAANPLAGSVDTMVLSYSAPTTGVVKFRFFNNSGQRITLTMLPQALPQAMSLTGLINSMVVASTNPDAIG